MGSDTQKNILDAGRREFLDKGFTGASLRSIAARARVTTGAIYGYYPGKNTLFRALVEPYASEFRENFVSAQNAFARLPAKEQVLRMHDFSNRALQALLDHVYANFDAFRLIVCSSAGTEYENYVESLADIETARTKDFAAVARRMGCAAVPLSDNLIHILCRAYFSAVFETVAHGMDKAEAENYIARITSFFGAGWDDLLGLKAL